MKLILVYNADSGWFNQFILSAHKILRPSTYACSLCGLTHHSFGEKSKWKAFIKTHPLEFEFLHKNEIEDQKTTDPNTYPLVYLKSQDCTEILLSATEIRTFQTTDDLIHAITHRLNTIQSK